MRDPSMALTIGGSDVAALYGVDPRRDGFSLWVEKKQLLPREAPTTRMLMGKALEQALCPVFNDQTGLHAVWDDETRVHPDRPFQSYTVDARIPSCNWGVDFKVVAYDQRWLWGPTPHQIPLRVQLQAAWYMAALDADVWLIAAYVQGDTANDPLRIYELHRDRALEGPMLRKAETFWRRYLVGDEEPPLNTSPHARAWLHRRFPANRPEPPRRATLDEEHLLDFYSDLRAQRSKLNKEIERVENLLTPAVGDGSGIQSPDHIFTWKKTADKEVLDYKNMAIALLYNHIKDPADRAALQAQYTKTEQGYRRVWFKDKKATATKEEED
jgi:predicted phage-related endonuclease